MTNNNQPNCNGTNSTGHRSNDTNLPLMTKTNSSDCINNGSVNIFRDTAVRYLGYANEIGESFRYQYPKFVIPSYVVAFGYCLADAIHTGYQSYYNHHHHYNKITDPSTSNNSNSNHHDEQLRIRRMMVGTFDTLLWQSFASVFIPGYVIHTIVKVTKYSITRIIPQQRHVQLVVPIFITTWLPTIMGLGAIPFIVHPIDHSVDYVLDNTVRTYYRQYF